ncbi:hypothetical protein FSP39_021488 [Pinctada imbricata]|uniref:RING-type E3 ubiquitin transferase n=1 Tax=Pinctada imbricata TaxID=66713 RepID=A0AA89C5S2_PINIB|nr:hypothetical protein FSP39_021488 [Pinctada imbricata]
MDEQSLNELLECSVCLERLDHTSKVLPCQHTFCRRCLQEIVSTKRELRCPECRTVVDIPVNDLPSNILLIRLLEGIKTKNTERTRSPHRYDDHHGLSAGGVRQLRQGLVGNQPCAKALFNYEGKDSGDLSFKKGDIIILKRQVDENWFHGEFNGQHGFFPATYVQELVPLPVTTPQCKALYDFDFENENEKKDCLCFKKDEILTVIKRVDDNWLEGKKGDKFGIFPISFVELNDAAKALIHSKSSSMHAVSGNHGNGDGALSSTTNMLNPLAFAGQIPQKRHSFTATPVESKPSSANKHYRRSLELSSKGNLVALPLVTQAEQVPPPVPSHHNSHASSTNNSSLSSVPSTSQAASTRVPDYDVEQPGPSNHLVIAMFNYKPQKEDELELKKGDQYSVLEMCQDGWYKGQCLKSTKMGVFPGNYVQKTRGPSAFRPISNVQNVRAKGHSAPGASSSTSAEGSSSKGKHHLSYAVERPPDREARKSSSPARQSSASVRSSVSPQRSSQNAPPAITPRSSKTSSVPSTSTSSSVLSSATLSSAANHKSTSATNRAPPSGDNQTQPHSGKSHHSSASSMPAYSRKGNNSSSADQHVLVSLSSVPHSMTATASGGSNGTSIGATGETVPSTSKDKQKDKKEKEKISLVKRLVSSGKSKKSKPVNDSTLAAAALDKNTNHTRSGSCPSETAPHSEGQHVKTGSFDSSTNSSASVPPKPNRPKAVMREKFRCREPYPPQSEIELELKVGDIVFVYKKREDGWFKGTLQRTGKTGLFPGSFVEKID